MKIRKQIREKLGEIRVEIVKNRGKFSENQEKK